jgi:hypothetical protein
MIVLDIPWRDLPVRIRQQWWEATDYNRHPPAPEFAVGMPELLAVEQANLETTKREIAADIARARELLTDCWRQQPPLQGQVDHLGRGCSECLRPTSPCKERCLRSVLQRPEGKP